jgi:hypothetical protein
MRARRLLILAMLMGWVMFSPVAIACGGCIGMWSTCESPCVLSSCALPMPAPRVVPQVVAYRWIEPQTYVPTPIVKVLKPPPKSRFSPSHFPQLRKRIVR